ncbi:MAG: hypothetical protein WD227_10095 [Vicinamibacterales bacterium]
MKRQWILAVVAFAWIVPAAALAQSQVSPAPVLRPTVLPVQAAPTGTRTVVGAVETRITPDRPYSAEAVNETVQVLADGNRISRRSVTKVYRDSAGRTRREVLDDDGSVRSISISDPVARVSYTLDPKAKAAFRAGATSVVAPTIMALPRETPVAATASGGGRGGAAGVGTGAGTATATVQGGFATGGGGGRGGMTRVQLHDKENVTKEEIGPENIEGVSAAGTRTTTTIPAGQIGNAQEIKVVSERWFSDELQVLVMTKHSDPRSGETTYRLTNILRAEPDPSFFTVPADYTVQERQIRELRREH